MQEIGLDLEVLWSHHANVRPACLGLYNTSWSNAVSHHNCLGSKRSYQLQLSAFPKTDLKNHSNRGFDEMTSIVTGSFFEMLLAARCINRLHRRINACGSADYFAIWHRNCIDVGGLKMDSWRASVFATCVPIFGLACKGKTITQELKNGLPRIQK